MTERAYLPLSRRLFRLHRIQINISEMTTATPVPAPTHIHTPERGGHNADVGVATKGT